jgi:hypothetical protein
VRHLALTFQIVKSDCQSYGVCAHENGALRFLWIESDTSMAVLFILSTVICLTKCGGYRFEPEEGGDSSYKLGKQRIFCQAVDTLLHPGSLSYRTYRARLGCCILFAAQVGSVEVGRAEQIHVLGHVLQPVW